MIKYDSFDKIGKQFLCEITMIDVRNLKMKTFVSKNTVYPKVLKVHHHKIELVF